MFYTYVLLSSVDDKLYIGFTEDLRLRLDKHNSGNVPATKQRCPLKLVYYEACRDKQKALDRERYFKTGFGRRYLSGRI